MSPGIAPILGPADGPLRPHRRDCVPSRERPWPVIAGMNRIPVCASIQETVARHSSSRYGGWVVTFGSTKLMAYHSPGVPSECSCARTARQEEHSQTDPFSERRCERADGLLQHACTVMWVIQSLHKLAIPREFACFASKPGATALPRS